MTTVSPTIGNALAEASAKINFATEQIAVSIAQINRSLSSLNIGLPVWRYLEPGDSLRERIGYARLHGKWGLCLGSKDKEWHFNDAPRSLRLEAINSIPDLLKDLTKESCDIAGLIEAKLCRMRGMN